MITALILMCLAASGCAWLGNPDQGTSGMTRLSGKMCEAKNGDRYLCEFSFLDGKDRASVTMSFKDAEGREFKLKTVDLQGIIAQARRAQLEEVLGQAGLKRGTDAFNKMLKLLAPVPLP